jgi:glycosyltransferase involved in cell wall biosynthesis
VQADQFARDELKCISVRKDLGVDNETILVGYLGSYAFYHDTARLVLAAEIIRESDVAEKVKILMVGAGKEYADSRKLADGLGLLDDMLIMKPGVAKDEVPGILAALDIAILPGSTDIICPIKIQEYMACELPSIVPDYTCNREVLDNGRTGVLFSPRDEQDLAAKICALAVDSQARLHIGQEARKEVQRRFTWENTWGAALEKILRTVV